MDARLRKAVTDIARDIHQLQKRMRAMETAAQGKFRSVSAGGTSYYDENGEVRVILGNQGDGSYTIFHQNSPALPPPSDPTVTTQPGLVIVTWDGTCSNGKPWSLDFSHVDVHVNAVAAQPPTNDNQVATFPVLTGGTATIAVDDGSPVFVTLTSVNRSDARSDPSGEVTVTPPIPITTAGIKTYYTDEEPLGLDAADTGALWYDTNNDNLQKRWDGVDWIDVPVGGAALKPGSVGADQLNAEAVTGLTFTGNTFRTAATGSRYELSPQGLLFYDASETPRPVATNGADLGVSNLVVDNDATFSGTAEFYGPATMNAGVNKPTTAPILSLTWKGVTPSSLAGAGAWQGLCSDVGPNWITLDVGNVAPVVAPSIVKINKTTGAVSTQALTWSISGTPSSSNPRKGLGITRIVVGGVLSYFVLTVDNTFRDYKLHKFDSAFNEITVASIGPALVDPNALQDPVIGTDGTNVLITYITTNGFNSSQWGASVKKWSTALVGLPSSFHPWLSRIRITAMHGSSADLGGPRWFFAHASDVNIRVADTGTSLRSINDEWQTPTSGQKGLWWDGTRFWGLDGSGRINRYSVVTADRVESYSYAWTDGTFVTQASNSSAINRLKRSYVHVQTTAPPALPVGLKARVYAGINPATRSFQFDMTVGQREIDYGDVTTGGGSESGSNTFVGVAAAGSVEAASGSFKIDGASNGSVGTGTFRTSVRDALVKIGSDTSSTMVDSGNVGSMTRYTITHTITFTTPFPSGTTVAAWVIPTHNGITNPVASTVTSTSSTAFTFTLGRAISNATSFTWVAMASGSAGGGTLS